MASEKVRGERRGGGRWREAREWETTFVLRQGEWMDRRRERVGRRGKFGWTSEVMRER